MLRQRNNDSRSFPFRMGRFFSVNGEWYFSSRESAAHGPFIDRATAEEACRRYTEAKRMRQSVRRAG